MDQDKKKQERDFKYVYFIENHEASEEVNIDFSKEYNEANELIKVFELNENQNKYKCSIYRFKFYPSKVNNQKETKNEIIITLENKNRNKFNGTITISSDSENIYIYDFKFEKMEDLKNIIEPPNSYRFNHMEQYDIYLDYIQNKLNIKNLSSPEISDLVSSTLNFFNGNDKKYAFSFYLTVLLQCFESNYFKTHLNTFQLNKIQEVGIISEQKKKLLSEIIKKFFLKFEEIIKEKEDEYGVKLISIILYYNYIFEPNGMKEIINNENEKTKLYKYRVLNEFSYLFRNLRLTEVQIQNLINISKNYDQLIDSLKYSNNLLEFMQIISKNFNKFYDMYEAEKKSHPEKSLVIDIDSIITLDKNDNLKEIYEEYNKLIKMQLKKQSIFLFFPENLCEKYANIFDGEDIDNLYHLKKIIELNTF